MDNACNKPAEERRDKDDRKRIAQALDTALEIHLRDIEPACDQRKAGDDKEHGTDVARFVRKRRRIEDS